MNLTLKGFWQSLDQVQNYLADIQKGVEALNGKSITMLFDVSNFEIPHPEITILQIQAQKLIVNSRLIYTAEVVPSSVITKKYLDQYSKKSSMNKRSFNNYTEAEKWLDEL